MENIIKSEKLKITINLDEYIPLKVTIDRKNEPIINLNYSKDKKSLLEITVGITSRLIKKITLLLSKEYDFSDSKLIIDDYELGDFKLSTEIDNNCSYFKTHLYEDGIRIVISDEKVIKYIKMEQLYIGLSYLDSIAEICLCNLTLNEVNHIKNELDYQ